MTREAPRRANPIVSVPTWHCRWTDIFAGEIAESFDILGQFNANGCRILEKALVVAVIASHVQLGAVVPVAFIVRKPLCVAVRFDHFVIVCRGNVEEAYPAPRAIESTQEVSAGIEREREH